jgi:hypothetical protein
LRGGQWARETDVLVPLGQPGYQVAGLQPLRQRLKKALGDKGDSGDKPRPLKVGRAAPRTFRVTEGVGNYLRQEWSR